MAMTISVGYSNWKQITSKEIMKYQKLDVTFLNNFRFQESITYICSILILFAYVL